MRAAVSLVAERGTANVSVGDIAETADISRQALYQHFGDRDTLLLEAALDLLRSALQPSPPDESAGMSDRDHVLILARHFAEHGPFYRAMLTSPSGFALNRALSDFFLPFTRANVARRCGNDLDSRTVDDVAAFITGGSSAFFNVWVVESDDPLDPEALADRLIRVTTALGTIATESPQL
ncbi:TetR/AcrR family transcriptional regulator [Lentzea alba]|nr:TetR/AcrR family transcriptional regulator [Lentzea alba]